MNSSPEAPGRCCGSSASSATGLATPELRSGDWTRLGGATVLGDAVTERTLSSLAESTRAAARAQGYAEGWAQGRAPRRTRPPDWPRSRPPSRSPHADGAPRGRARARPSRALEQAAADLEPDR